MTKSKPSYEELEIQIAELKKQNELLLLDSKSVNSTQCEHYRLLFENSLEGFAFCKMLYENNMPIDFIYLDVNPAFEELTGLKDVIGRKVTEIIPNIKETNPEVFRMYASVSSSSWPIKFEMYFEVLKRWLSISVITPEKGYFAILFDNITGRKKIELALKESKEKYKNLVHLSPDIIYKHSTKRGGLFWSERVKDILGFETEEIYSNPFLWTNSIHSDDKENVLRAVNNYKPNENNTVEYRIKTKAGKWIWLHDTFRAIDKIDDEIIFEGHAADVTAQKETEIALIESERKFKDAFDFTGIGMALISLDGKFIKVNQAACKVGGYTEEELQNKTFQEITHPDDLQENLKLFHQAIDGKINHYNLPKRYISKTGQIVWANLNVSIVRDAENKPVYFVSQIEDITKQIRYEQELKNVKDFAEKNELIFYGMFEQAAVGVAIIETATGRFKQINKKYCEICGYTEKELLETDFMTITHHEDLKWDLANMQRLKKGEINEFSMDKRYFRKDGSIVWVRLSVSALIKVDNSVETHIAIVEDVADRKNAELQVQQYVKELNTLVTDKDRFISILAHDLKSPFSSILGFLEILSENIHDYDIDEIEKMIHIIHDASKKTYNLLEDVLMWTRAQSGKLPFEPEELNFTITCLDLIEIMNPNAIAKSIALNYISMDGINILADKNMLNTILRNLVANAIKFTQNGGKICISAERKEQNVTISVSDTGIGISPEKIPTLFDATQTQTTNGTANEKGSGIGLLLCKEFVEKHGGKIWVESVIGKGSNFLFTLPVVPIC